MLDQAIEHPLHRLLYCGRRAHQGIPGLGRRQRRSGNLLANRRGSDRMDQAHKAVGLIKAGAAAQPGELSQIRLTAQEGAVACRPTGVVESSGGQTDLFGSVERRCQLLPAEAHLVKHRHICETAVIQQTTKQRRVGDVFSKGIDRSCQVPLRMKQAEAMERSRHGSPPTTMTMTRVTQNDHGDESN
ncbi:hypothetical protein [Prochlorococcus sp. MIT 1201]|uniref:hypothetical protein n=1 Tax=Prochlorococcus sp. MIT 1201 TaxID=3082535 RepID=UPI0039A5BE07